MVGSVKLDVVDDQPRSGGVELPHDAGVQRALEGPALLEVAEALGVDADDEEAVDRLRPAHVEARLERLTLERRERAALAGGETDGARGQRDEAERSEATASCEWRRGGTEAHQTSCRARRSPA
jgi:hypothetical protein